MYGDVKVTVLHLSDLHFSKNVDEDIDVKAPVLLNTKSEKIDKFIEYIKSLPSKPDYVVVSGDITQKGKIDGFNIFNEIIVDLIRKGKLPSVDRFIIVPGNHDVKAGASLKETERWDYFRRTIGNKYLTPWIVGVSAGYETMTALVDKTLAKETTIKGGIVQDLETGERNSIPFLLDMERKVLFYAFNSSLLSHTKLNNDASEIIDFVKKYKAEEKDYISIIQKYEAEMSIDPARIIGDEIKLFTYCIRQIKDILKDEFNDYLKIAVLHHHVAPIACTEELKKFELLINSGIFKKALVDFKFNVVLHGHKHWNEVFWDTAISGGGALLVISGGTICGVPGKNKKPGFYYLEFCTKDKLVETNYYELQDTYRSFTDINEKRLFSYDTLNKNVGQFSDVQYFDIKEMVDRVKSALLQSINCKDYANNKLYGWSRIITTPNKVGMIATAQGLILASLLRINDILFIEKKEQILNTLWQFRLPNGGFSAISQSENASIEATVWAVRAFYTIGDYQKYQSTLQDLYKIIQESELNEESSITTLTLVMDLLCDCEPDSELLAQLERIVLDKAYYKNGKLLYWPASNAQEEMGSAIHSVLAVISLLKFAGIQGRLKKQCNYLYDCGEWILAAKWDNVEEIISRQISVRKEDRLVYQHYTSTWAIVALLRLGYHKNEKRICDEMAKLLRSEHNGLWPWNGEHNYPIWAIYDAFMAINEYILCDFTVYTY